MLATATKWRKLIRQLVPEFDGIKKTALITHADVDHCGLLPQILTRC